MDKETVLTFIRFMFSYWNDIVCKEVFADAPCGWEHIWSKWMYYRDMYGFDGAILHFYADGLDSHLQTVLADFIGERSSR